MKGIVIKTRDKTEFKFLSDLLKKLGISSESLSAEELEDLGLAKMMKSVDRAKKVSRESVMKKVKS